MNTDFESLLKPISAEAPAGRLLRGEAVYRDIEDALKEDLSGSAYGGVLIRARPDNCAALAIDALSSQTKDLKIAVWLAEALVRLDGFDGLRRALDLIRELMAAFWETIYPLPPDDEEIRSAPLSRLTGKVFCRVIDQMIPITKDGYTRLDQKLLETIPFEKDVGSDEELAKARLDAEMKKRVLPEHFAESLRDTDITFYERMSTDILAAKEAARQLEQECEARFTDPENIPRLAPVVALFDPYLRLASEAIRQKTTKTAVPIIPPPIPVATEVIGEPISPPEISSEPSSVVSVDAQPITPEPVNREDAARLVFVAARFLRNQNPSDPAAFLLTRCWHFGAAIGRGGIDDGDMEPPPADLRKELWGLHLEKNWDGLLDKVETAMELPCAASWLDLHYYSGSAMENLGETYLAARTATGALVHQYVQRLPDLPQRRLLDGTPAASPATARWLESLTFADAKPWEAVTAPPNPETGLAAAFEQPKHNDSFGEAVRLADSGRIAEALKAFYEGQQAEDTGCGRFESRLRVAGLCMTAKEHTLAIPLLRQASHEIREWRLEEWDPALSARALAMLHECLVTTSATDEEIAGVFARICVMDPLLAVKLGDRR